MSEKFYINDVYYHVIIASSEPEVEKLFANHYTTELFWN